MSIPGYVDLIAALGVIVTMLLLAWELRMTRHEARLSNWRELLQSLSGFKALTNDPEFAEFVVRAEADFGALTEVERRRFGMYLEQGLHIIGNFLKHDDSLPARLVGLERAAGNLLFDLMSSPGARAWLDASRDRARFMPQTYDMVDRVLANGRQTTGGR